MTLFESKAVARRDAVTLDIRVRTAIIGGTALLLCSYALLWNLAVVHYYDMLSDPKKNWAGQLITLHGRILWHVLLLPCLASLYFAATSQAATTGHGAWIALKQLGMWALFVLLVPPLLMLATFLTNAGDTACLRANACVYVPRPEDWINAALYYSPIYTLGLFLILGLMMYAKYRQEQMHAAALHANWLQARLETLRVNLHPHFLFNTLNTISALVTTRPEEARDLIAELAALLRESIRDTDSEFCRLGHERELAEKYLRIITARFGDRFKPNMHVPESLKSLVVPRGLLLTLIENAVTHGVSELTGDCGLTVDCESVGDRVTIIVRNRCDARHMLSSERRGGLAALDTRLQVLYGGTCRFAFGVDGTDVWCARVELPAMGTARSVGRRNVRDEKLPAPGQFFDDSPAHSRSMGQEAAEK